MKRFRLLLPLFFGAFFCFQNQTAALPAALGLPSFLPEKTGPTEVAFSEGQFAKAPRCHIFAFGKAKRLKKWLEQKSQKTNEVPGWRPWAFLYLGTLLLFFAFIIGASTLLLATFCGGTYPCSTNVGLLVGGMAAVLACLYFSVFCFVRARKLFRKRREQRRRARIQKLGNE